MANPNEIRLLREARLRRNNPLVYYDTERKFRRRYRLEKQAVRDLAFEFGQSRFATKGLRNGGGLSHVERVSTILIVTIVIEYMLPLK